MTAKVGIRRYIVALVATASVSFTHPFGADAQDWRAALKAEKAKNSEQVEELEKKGFPLLDKLKQVNAAIATHNAHVCIRHTAGECAAYDSEAKALDNQKQSIENELTPIMELHDKLLAKNTQIEKQLQVHVQLPHTCVKSSDCEVSHCCGEWDWKSETGICQPSC
jgi:predicted  nucleic acid-binding Zn-ribbon protein